LTEFQNGPMLTLLLWEVDMGERPRSINPPGIAFMLSGCA
jgi:hypothetical protein